MIAARPKRVLAAFAAVSVLFAGLLAMRHEAAVAHVRDHATGAWHHAHELAEHHDHSSTTPHLHGREVHDHADVGACHLLAGLEQASVLPVSHPILELAQPVDLDVAELTSTAHAPHALYRLAPKTSPPAHALS